MISFIKYLSESLQDFEVDIGWWQDQKILKMYHGTHLRNVDSIKKVGINRKDPETGMISMAFDPYTAHGYAAMSGHGGVFAAKTMGRVKSTPHEERRVLVAELPIKWVMDNYDKSLGGNSPELLSRLRSKDEYEKHKADGKSDISFYKLAELRFKAIPAKYIKRVISRY